ncbi:metallophosphoesterase family protein [Enterococcus eurekensis]|uniref:Metallophosphoesterase family protein n=1 Tax=Enterococcus eurekensis TaxID=1159753 RepID=A0ABV9M170_9ENTE
MKTYVYVLSDIHGQLDLFEKLLEDFDPVNHQLVLIGDLNDRGPKSKACFLKGKELVEKYQAIYLRGNHEDYFLKFLANPEEVADRYWLNGGRETINSLLHPGATEEYSPTEMAMMMRGHYKELIEFLKNLPYYFEWGKYLFVHAGVNLALKDWHQTTPRELMWIRDDFHQGVNHTGKTIVFGHTITPSLHGDNRTTDLWFSDNKIGIDGGAIYGGSVHGVIFDKKGIVQDIEYQKMTASWNPNQ